MKNFEKNFLTPTENHKGPLRIFCRFVDVENPQAGIRNFFVIPEFHSKREKIS